jgi:hypothetical protein
MEPRAVVLKCSFDVAHMVFNAVVNDLDDEMASFQLPGGMVPCASAMIAHALYAEDATVAQAADSPTVLESAGRGAATGIVTPSLSMTPEWLAATYKLSGLKEYAAAVFGNTSAFLASATAGQLDRKVTSPFGDTVTAAELLAGLGVVHISEHAGEVSTLKGAQGVKGLPF